MKLRGAPLLDPGDRSAAAAELGIRGNAFAMIVKYAVHSEAVPA